MSNHHGYIAPQSIPEETICRILRIPKDPHVLAAVNGAVTQLARWYNWESPDGLIMPGVIAARMSEMVDEYFQSDCEVLNLEFTIVDCELLWRQVEGSAWINLGNVCGADGDQGEQGPQGPPGEKGDQGAVGPQGLPGEDADLTDIIYTPEPNAGATAGEKRCAAANYLVEWLFEKFGDVIDDWEATADAISALDGFTALMPPAYLIVDEVFDFFNEIVEAGTAVSRAYDTVEHREEHANFIYCLLGESSDLTEAMWLEYVDSDGDFEFHLGRLTFWQFLKTIKPEGAIARANMGTYLDGYNCLPFTCQGEWLQDFWAGDGNIFTTSGVSFSFVYGTYDADQDRLQGTLDEATPEFDNTRVELLITFASPEPILSFEADISSNSTDPALVNRWAIYRNDVLHSQDDPPSNANLNTTISADGFGDDTSTIRIVVNSSEPEDGLPASISQLQRFRIRGDGTNPWSL